MDETDRKEKRDKDKKSKKEKKDKKDKREKKEKKRTRESSSESASSDASEDLRRRARFAPAVIPPPPPVVLPSSAEQAFPQHPVPHVSGPVYAVPPPAGFSQHVMPVAAVPVPMAAPVVPPRPAFVPPPVPQAPPPPQAPTQPPPVVHKVYVGNINFAYDEHAIRETFESRFGSVRNVELKFDFQTNHHRGFAFVEFEDAAGVQRALDAPPGSVQFGGKAVRINRPTEAQRNGQGVGSTQPQVNVLPQVYLGKLDSTIDARSSQSMMEKLAAKAGIAMPTTMAPPAAAPAPARPPPSSTRFVAITNMIAPDGEVDDDLENDVRSECERKCGPVVAVHIYQEESASGHREASVLVEFGNDNDAKKCVALMNARSFAGRRLGCGFVETSTYFDIVRALHR